jgi:hypothetical protein
MYASIAECDQPATARSSAWNGNVPKVNESPTIEIRVEVVTGPGAAFARPAPSNSSAAHDPIAAVIPARRTCRRVDSWGVDVGNTG